ncbi:Bacteriophage HK97-gp10, putative tail-component [Caloramator quimbayensis]|uniref:Bacteriophage HK97-gp10, putative tail-component n=1 Tax=Caloramator quimbayensis TaxID=1147123 RepID=A0A1T4YC52_9CLOT|nr:HK97 gp10 family phage protein [Caloramator quimbayensis]SKA99349.1 Bacteriophage HK97-gp10, putative tail-component [Caloramator quimbayensis]
MGVKTFGFDDFEKALNNMINKFPESAKNKLGQIADEVIADTKLNTPVRTGILRRSFIREGAKQEGNVYKVKCGSNILYAPFVEEGHKTGSGGFVKGRHMFKNALTKAEKKMPEKLKGLLDEITRV